MTLEEKFVEYCIAVGCPPETDTHYAFKWNAHPHFLAGAAAMAEILAVNNEPLTTEIAMFRSAITNLAANWLAAYDKRTNQPAYMGSAQATQIGRSGEQR